MCCFYTKCGTDTRLLELQKLSSENERYCVLQQESYTNVHQQYREVPHIASITP